MQITSSSIDNGRILKEQACAAKGGYDQSPQLSIRDVPPETRFFAIVVDDPDAVKPTGRVWVHWNLFNVPARPEMDIEAGQPPEGEPGLSSGDKKAYEGMCPPDGVHTYRFAVFACPVKLPVGGPVPLPPMTIEDFEQRFRDKILAKAVITGRF